MKKVISMVLALTLLTCQTAFADSIYLKFSGKTETDAKGATILVLEKDADVNNVTAQDIVYINQSSISEDGSFTMTIPFFIEEDYIVRSNALESELKEPVKDKILYVSENGSDTNTGESADSPLKTLAKAYLEMIELKEIKIIGSVAYTDPGASYEGGLTISGADSTATLTVPSEISLKGDLTLSNLAISGGTTFYANGNHLKIEETVTTSTKLTAYGACKTEELTGDTNLEILGGKWSRIYGGGQAAVNGNTNLVVGGKVNDGCLINDKDSSTFSYCNIFGGGNNAAVSGETNVHLTGSAVVAYTIGAGIGANGTATETNILIDENAKCMNVYGGSYDSAISATTNVTLSGNALVEAIFGGSQNAALTGHTNVNLLGGDVSRRVYTGCYNNATRNGLSLSWSSAHYVTGTTTLRIGKNAKVNTQTDLHSDNANNIGVYAGSRIASSSRSQNEKNTIIFLDNSYSSFSGEIGTQDISALLDLKSGDYLTVKAGLNGDVTGTGAHGVIRVIPDNGYYGTIGSATYKIPTDVTISGTTTVTFGLNNFYVNVNEAGATENGASANVDVTANNTTGEVTPKLIVALYDDVTGKLVDCSIVDAASETDKTISFTGELLADRTYTVKATIWNGNIKPLTAVSKISFTK